jgi:DnaJ-class molecular chaperone
MSAPFSLQRMKFDGKELTEECPVCHGKEKDAARSGDACQNCYGGQVPNALGKELIDFIRAGKAMGWETWGSQTMPTRV